MKKLLFLLFTLSGMHCTPGEVYICDSKNASTYHYKENCRGLGNCQHHVVKTTIEEARKNNKRLCKWEQ